MRRAWIAVTTAGALAAAACGSQETGYDPGLYGGGTGGNNPVFTQQGADGGVVVAPPVPDACRTGQALAQKLPLHIVLMLDRSGSMCEYVPGQDNPRDCNNPNSKWQQVRGALAYFFNNATSQGITLTVTQFPADPNGDGNNCNPNLYAQPKAQLVPLPDPAGTLLASIDSRQSSNAGNTPTLDAIRGGLTIAQQIQASLTTPGRVAALMATDGKPAGCADADNIGASAQVASLVAQSIPTYVIGVGNELGALDLLAQGGGTQKAFIANTFNPALVGQYVSVALDAIRKSAVGCEYTVPPPPDGKQLDPQKVNVEFTGGAGKSTIGYSQGCTNPNGWTYDNAAAPHTVKLCPNICNAVGGDSTGRIDLIFGCKTDAIH
jgi:hypothetical protein